MAEEPKYPSDLADRFQVRMPPGLRDRIAAAADTNGRSMNSEIVATLEEKYPKPESEQLAEMFKIVDEMLAKADNDQERRYMLKRLIDMMDKEMGSRQTNQKPS